MGNLSKRRAVGNKLRKQFKWRPIKTAPKMKTLILWAATDVADTGEIKNWKMQTGFWSAGAECWIWEGSQIRKYDIQPTHWMPLPDPPL